MANTDSKPGTGRPISRRALLIGGGVAGAALAAAPLVRRWLWPRTGVFIASGQRYDGPLVQTIRDGLLASGVEPAQMRGKRVLLKPNLVEPTRSAPHMTTHPAMVVAAAEVFCGWGAEVKVGEAPGHVRDTEMALAESGLGAALDDAGVPFADLNYEQVAWVANAGRVSKLDGLYFPQSVIEADLVVSMPKMKTHHWVGMTAAMKNLYGTLPGIKYGWPKNVLHYAGIPESVVDINASLPCACPSGGAAPRRGLLAIVDGILCMEGDGPIMGSPKPMGLVIIGANVTAVDATVARLMGIDPELVTYLRMAKDRLGPLDERHIEQRGERWEPLASPFEILDAPHLERFRRRGGELVT